VQQQIAGMPVKNNFLKAVSASSFGFSQKKEREKKKGKVREKEKIVQNDSAFPIPAPFKGAGIPAPFF